MMFFRSNKEVEPNKLFDYFYNCDNEELALLADEISEDAHDMFEFNLENFLGSMPDEIAQTNITMNRNVLKHMLLSSMVTGYVTKSIENKLSLEKYWQNDIEENIIDKLTDKKSKILTDDDLDAVL